MSSTQSDELIAASRRAAWLSLGENCLPDRILQRHGLKSFSTPFSNGRSNIDVLLALWRAKFDGLLDPANLRLDPTAGASAVRSTRYVDCDPIFDPSVSGGFEFTHHNVLEDAAARDSYVRKIDNFCAARLRGDVVLVYYHRPTPRSDLPALIQKLETFAQLYQVAENRVRVLLLRQTLVAVPSERGVVSRSAAPHVDDFEVKSLAAWGGQIPAVFWAEVDDDLLTEVLAAGREWLVGRETCDDAR